MIFLNEQAIKQVMQDTGMDYLQARNHVTQRTFLTERRSRERDPFPLGKNAMIDHDAEYAIWLAKQGGDQPTEPRICS